MKNKIEFKPFDKVLVRDKKEDAWRIDLFERYIPEDCYNFNYSCLRASWKECIPYKDNEHLLGTTDTPKRYNLDNDTLFEIKLKPGYVLEFVNGSVGVLFPIHKTKSPDETFFAVMFDNGSWAELDNIDLKTITAIREAPCYGCCLTSSEYLFTSSEYLWKKE